MSLQAVSLLANSSISPLDAAAAPPPLKRRSVELLRGFAPQKLNTLSFFLGRGGFASRQNISIDYQPFARNRLVRRLCATRQRIAVCPD